MCFWFCSPKSYHLVTIICEIHVGFGSVGGPLREVIQDPRTLCCRRLQSWGDYRKAFSRLICVAWMAHWEQYSWWQTSRGWLRLMNCALLSWGSFHPWETGLPSVPLTAPPAAWNMAPLCFLMLRSWSEKRQVHLLFSWVRMTAVPPTNWTSVRRALS